MDEQSGAIGVRRRRSRAEVEQLIAELATSGLNRTEFCRAHGISLSTLNRYRNRKSQQSGTAMQTRLVAVELSESGSSRSAGAGSGLAVVSAGGWRIDVACGFDGVTLGRLLRVLERI
jgi:transposase-like protein